MKKITALLGGLAVIGATILGGAPAWAEDDPPPVVEVAPAVEPEAPAAVVEPAPVAEPAPVVEPVTEDVIVQTEALTVQPLSIQSAPSYVWVAWQLPAGQAPNGNSVGASGFPQTYLPNGENSAACGFWVQVDKYKASEAPGFYADGILTYQEDWGNSHQTGAIEWYFKYAGDCAPPPVLDPTVSVETVCDIIGADSFITIVNPNAEAITVTATFGANTADITVPANDSFEGAIDLAEDESTQAKVVFNGVTVFEQTLTQDCHGPNALYLSHNQYCGGVDITLRNVSPWIYPTSVEVDGVHSYGPTVDNRTNGGLNGPQKDQSKTRTITFPEDSGEHTVRYRIDAGSERDLYIGTSLNNWVELTIVSDCAPPPPPVVVPYPPAPVFEDECGPDNHGFSGYADDANGSWKVTDHVALNGKYAIRYTLNAGLVFPNGQTYKQWTEVPDQADCPIVPTPAPTPPAPTPPAPVPPVSGDDLALTGSDSWVGVSALSGVLLLLGGTIVFTRRLARH